LPKPKAHRPARKRRDLGSIRRCSRRPGQRVRLIVYSSTNEQEGLPLFKLFTDVTGIKVEYVRASDAILMSRMSMEFRADQKSYDIVQTATINKMPLQMLAAYEPPEAGNISPDARDPNKRWYGVYANYNAPAFNTGKVKASDLPKSYEEFAQHKEWPARSPSTAPTTNGSRQSCSITGSRRASSW